MRGLWCVMMMAICSACDEPVSDDQPVDDQPVDDPSDELPEDAVTVLELPVIAVRDVQPYLVMQTDADTGVMSGETVVRMGWGQDYSTTLTFELDQLAHNQCWELKGVFREEFIETSNPDVLTFRGREIQAHKPGVSRVTLRGVYHPQRDECPRVFTKPGSVPVEISIDVEVVEPAASQWVRPALCRAALKTRVVSGGVADGLLPVASARGRYLHFANAAPARQVGLTLTAPKGGGLIPPAEGGGLDEVRFVGASGEVQVQTSTGDRLELEVVARSELTDMDTQFIVPWAQGRIHLFLHDGDTVHWSRTTGTRRMVVPFVGALIADGDPLCTPPQAEWFELRQSDCGTVDQPTEDTWGNRRTVGLGVTIEQDGLCELELVAPDLGDGLSVPIGVTFSE